MKTFEWGDLKIFLAVQRGRSVRAASKLLGVSHSTVSRRLSAMEDQTGVNLFVRKPEGFVLTETGEAIVERAERVESEILSMEREVFGRDAKLSGPVRISAPPLLAQHLLMPILAEFMELYPEVDIEVDATFDVADLRRRNADIAIRFQVQPEKSLISQKLPDFANAIYATPAYVDAHHFDGANPTAKWVVVGGKEVLGHWRSGFAYSGCSVQHIVSDMMAQISAVKAGLGFGYLFCFVADADSELMRLALTPADKAIPTWIVTHPDLASTERVRVCARFLTKAIWAIENKISGSIGSR